MNENIQILEAKLWGVTDGAYCKKYPMKKAKQFIKVKAEIFMPNINNETMQALLKFAELKINLNKAMEELHLALYKQRNDIPTIRQQLNSCNETMDEIQEEVV